MTLPEPYYRDDDNGITLYCGDCLELLPLFEPGSVDAVVTDSPYEDMKGGTIISHPGVAQIFEHTVSVGDELGTSEGLLHARRIARRGAIAFCSYHWLDRCVELLGGKRRGLVSWYKRNSPPSVNNSPHFLTEYAWAVQYGVGIDWRGLRTHIDIPMLQGGCMASERIVNGGKALHPTQKPVALMLAVLLPGMDSVLDPYAGLGTTGVACLRTQRACTLIEKSEEYCEIAAERLRKEKERTVLFDRKQKPQQRELEFAT